MIIKAVLETRADVVNRNGYIYPRKVIEKALEEFRQKVKDGKALVTFEEGRGPHPPNPAGKINSINMNDKGLIETEIIPIGKAAEIYLKNSQFCIQGTRVKKSPPITVTDTLIHSINILPAGRE